MDVDAEPKKVEDRPGNTEPASTAMDGLSEVYKARLKQMDIADSKPGKAYRE